MDEFKQAYRTVMDDHFPGEMTISFGDQSLLYRKRTWRIRDEDTGQLIEKGLRYGENPGQEAVLYDLVGGNLVLGKCHFIDPCRGLVSRITDEDILQSGKHPGKINLTDVDNALNILRYLTNRPAVAIMKHNNPSGVAYGDRISQAYHRGHMADRIAAFGGCLVSNRPMDKELAEMIGQDYLEVLAAPDYEEGVLDILRKKRDLRIIRIGGIAELEKYQAMRFVDFKSLIDGGIIVQQSMINRILTKEDLKPAQATLKGKTYTTHRKPEVNELEDILFGWAVEQGVTSNSVIYVKDGATVGIGTGEQDRVGVAEIAIFKAYNKYADALCFNRFSIPYRQLEQEIRNRLRSPEEKEEVDRKVQEDHAGLNGAVMISDAFFPFRDGVDVAIREGISAIAHPGGSQRDFESIEACNEADPPVAMVFTGQRAFKH